MAVLLVVAKDDRRVRIEPGYGLEGAIPDAIANRIIQEYLAPKFRAGDYGGGIADATAQLVKLIDGEAAAGADERQPRRAGRRRRRLDVRAVRGVHRRAASCAACFGRAPHGRAQRCSAAARPAAWPG